MGITALAVVLRLLGLDFQSFWNDEIYSLAMAGTSLAESLELVGRDVHPPLYFLTLHAWVALFGNSEFSVRLLSALASVLAIPALFRLGRRLLGVRAGLVAAAICAVSTFQIYYAQEARSYALASFLAILSMDAFSEWHARGLRGARRLGPWIYYVAATSALLYTHYFGILVVVAQNAWLVGVFLIHRARRRKAARLPGDARSSAARAELRAWLGAQLALAAIFAAWIPVLFQQTGSVGSGDFWIQEPGSYMLGRSLLIFISLHPPPWGFLIPWSLLLRNFLVFSLVFASIAHFFGGRLTQRPLHDSRYAGEGGTVAERVGSAEIAPVASWTLLATWLLLPALLAFALSTFSLNVYTHRNLIVSSPALFLLIGGLFARLPGRVLPALLLAAALAPSVSLYPWYYGSVHKAQWREMATWLQARAEREDGFVFDAPFIRRNYDFYRGARDYYFVDARQKRAPRRERIWLIRAHQAADERRIPAAVEAWGYQTEQPQRFVDIEVYLYERR